MVSQAMATPAVTKRLEFRVPRFAPSSPFTATTLSTPTDNPISLDRGTSETDANRSASPSLGSSSSSSDSGEVKLAAAVRAQALPSRTDADELALSESENESVSLTVKKPLLAAPGGGASTSSNSTTSDHVITIGDDEGSLSQNASTGGSSALRNMSSNARHELQTRQVAAMEARARAERELAALHSEQTLAGALTRQSLSELKEMLAKGVDPDQKDASGEHSALHYAVYRVALPFAEALLDAKANVDIRNSRGETPLMWAVKTGSLKAVRLLHSRGADIHAQDNDGLTALHHTATMGHILVADFLLQHGHPLDIVDKKMKSAIFYAAWHDHRSFVEWLLVNGANPNVVDTTKSNFLHWAGISGSASVVQGAVNVKHETFHLLNKPDVEGHRPFDYTEPMVNPHVTLNPPRYSATAYAMARARGVGRRSEMLCGLLSGFSRLIAFLRGPLAMTNAIWYLTTLYIHITLLSHLYTIHPFVQIIFYFLMLVTALSWCRVLFGEVGGLASFSSETRGLPTYAKLHGEYLNRLNNGTLTPAEACTTCRIVKPIRSKHCGICNRCVAKFDHHCAFLDQDIGQGNYFYFILYLVAIGTAALQFIIMGAVYFFNQPDVKVALSQHPFLAVFVVMHLFPVTVPILLLRQHIPLIKTNLTTNEQINMGRYKHFWLDGNIVNPFSFGVNRNIKIFLGLESEPIFYSSEEAIRSRVPETTWAADMIKSSSHLPECPAHNNPFVDVQEHSHGPVESGSFVSVRPITSTMDANGSSSSSNGSSSSRGILGSGLEQGGYAIVSSTTAQAILEGGTQDIELTVRKSDAMV